MVGEDSWIETKEFSRYVRAAGATPLKSPVTYSRSTSAMPTMA